MIEFEAFQWLIVNLSPFALLRLGVVCSLIGLTWLLVTVDDHPHKDGPEVGIGPSIVLVTGVWFLGNVIGFAGALGL